jgi:hypothetical protein
MTYYYIMITNYQYCEPIYIQVNTQIVYLIEQKADLILYEF